MDVFNTAIVRAYKIDNKFDLKFDSYKFGTTYMAAFSYKL